MQHSKQSIKTNEMLHSVLLNPHSNKRKVVNQDDGQVRAFEDDNVFMEHSRRSRAAAQDISD